MKKIVIIGTGTWASALAQVLIDNGHQVILIGNDQSQIDDINLNHQNRAYFGEEIILPTSLKATSDYKMPIEWADYVLLAVPTQAMRSVLKNTIPYLNKEKVFINCAKGFDPETNMRISELIREVIPSKFLKQVVSLIGPSHAEEVIIRFLTTVCSVCVDQEIAVDVQNLFSNEYFRVYTLNDEVGAEIGVAVKNAIAIASGVLQGVGYGDNARAALVTRGLAEMVKLGMFFGGKIETYLGLTGLGDLMVTCNSIHSRNFNAGLKIGKDDDAQSFLSSNKTTVEGIRTIKVVHEIATKNRIEMPIVEALYQAIYEGKKPSEMITRLMGRPLKREQE